VKGYSHPRCIGGSPFYISNCTTLRILFCAILVLCLPFLASAQDTGSISGTVSDKSGAAVAGAEVTITSTAGSLTRSTVTNSDGAYVAAGCRVPATTSAYPRKAFRSTRLMAWCWTSPKRSVWTCNSPSAPFPKKWS